MAHARLAAQERVEQRTDLVDVEELGGSGAVEGAFDVGVRLRVAQPRAHGHREAELLAVRHFLRQHARGGFAQGDLVVLAISLEARRHAQGDVQHAHVHERHADVQARAAGDLRGVEQDAAFEVAAELHIEHPGQRVVLQAFFAAVAHERACGILRVVRLQVAAHLRRVHDVRGAEVHRVGAHVQALHAAVDAVAGEEFVGAFAREAQRRVLLHLLAAAVQRQAGHVRRRLLVGQQEFVDVAEEVFRGHLDAFEFAAEVRGGRAGILFLADFLVGVGNAESTARGAFCQDVGGVDAAGEEAVGHLALVHDITHGGVHGRFHFVRPVVERLRLVGFEGELPVAPKLKALGAEAEETARLQLADALEQGVLAGDVGELQVELHHFAVQLARVAGLVEEVLDLQAVEQAAVFGLVVEEELRAEGVARAEQLVGLGVAQHERELAVQVRAHLVAPCLVSGGDQLLFALGACEAVDVDAQFGGEFFVVANESSVGFDFDHASILRKVPQGCALGHVVHCEFKNR